MCAKGLFHSINGDRQAGCLPAKYLVYCDSCDALVLLKFGAGVRYLSLLVASFLERKCLGVRYRTPRPRVSASGTGPRDSVSRSPVPDAEPTQ